MARAVGSLTRTGSVVMARRTAPIQAAASLRWAMWGRCSSNPAAPGFLVQVPASRSQSSGTLAASATIIGTPNRRQAPS